MRKSPKSCFLGIFFIKNLKKPEHLVFHIRDKGKGGKTFAHI